MNQSKISSLIESVVSVAIGFVVGVLSQLLIFPLFGIYVTFASNVYMLRRWFNYKLHKTAKVIGGKF
jgi:uncharacterized membrane protein (DUF485 family)